MQINEMVIISNDDCTTKISDILDDHLSGTALATATKLQSKANGVSTAFKSSGGAASLGQSETRRSVKSGDIVAMLQAQAKTV